MIDANASAIIDSLIHEKKIRPLIVACPELPITSIEDFILAVASFVDATFRTIPQRESRAIVGHSMGGFESFSTGLQHPEIFSIMRGLNSSSLIVLNVDRLVEQYNLKSYLMRFWLYAETSDLWGHENFVEALRKHGFPTDFYMDDRSHLSKVAQRLGEFNRIYLELSQIVVHLRRIPLSKPDAAFECCN